MQIADLTQEQLNDLVKTLNEYRLQNTQKTDDIKVIRDVLLELLQMLGVVDKDKNFNENIQYSKLISTLTSYMMLSEKRRAEKFNFLTKLEPLLTKYKSL